MHLLRDFSSELSRLKLPVSDALPQPQFSLAVTDTPNLVPERLSSLDRPEMSSCVVVVSSLRCTVCTECSSVCSW